MGSKLEAVTEKALFSSRWILAPIFLGLSLAGYNVLISLLMAAVALWGFVGSAKRV